MKETFKDIKGYEDLYQVSNLGNVKSLARIVTRSDGRIRTLKERILKGTIDSAGYLTVKLCKHRQQKTHSLHVLVAITFLNHLPDGWNLVVNHIDLNKLNNNVINLEIVTARENSNHKHLKSSSKYVGVNWNKNAKKWLSRIYINGKSKHLGVFSNEEEAAKAYQIALNNLNK